MCNRVIDSDKPAEHFHPIMQFPLVSAGHLSLLTRTDNFVVLVHSHSFYPPFSKLEIPARHQTADRQSFQLADELNK